MSESFFISHPGSQRALLNLRGKEMDADLRQLVQTTVEENESEKGKGKKIDILATCGPSNFSTVVPPMIVS